MVIASLTTGSVNVYPSQRESIINSLNISQGLSTFMLTGGVVLMYFTLPIGVYLDKFGALNTLILSSAVTFVSYIVLSFVTNAGAFITFYLLMAFGSSSIFFVCLQISLSRSPESIHGISVSFVSASLSLSFGLFLEIYKAGKGSFKCKGYDCFFSGVQLVAIVVCSVVAVSLANIIFFYHKFPDTPQQRPSTELDSEASVRPPTVSRLKVLKNPQLYIYLFGMFMTVFDGMLVMSAGDVVWNFYGFKDAASKYGIAFSVTNCVSTVTLSFIIDFIINKYNNPRSKLFSLIWGILGLVPLVIGLLLQTTKNETLFAAFMSMMGIPFGLGLSQIPTLVFDVFGQYVYGFSFGIVQLGSIVASSICMPIMLELSKSGVVAIFIACAVLQITVCVLIYIFSLNKCCKVENDTTEYEKIQ
ncbi:transporter, major facilitator subfamily protein [Histomonas meleagridis]|nr:transporter, major facilitator subfamily protein [Histomonas meleagridis]